VAFEPVRTPPAGVIDQLGQLLPRVRDEIARLIDVEQAAVELLHRTVVLAHDRRLTDIPTVGQLLASQDDERAAGEMRALLRRAGIDYRREEHRATVNRATEVLRQADQDRPAG
jgi:hypothetical protein